MGVGCEFKVDWSTYHIVPRRHSSIGRRWSGKASVPSRSSLFFFFFSSLGPLVALLILILHYVATLVGSCSEVVGSACK